MLTIVKGCYPRLQMPENLLLKIAIQATLANDDTSRDLRLLLKDNCPKHMQPDMRLVLVLFR